MRIRTLLAAALVGVVAAGSATPSFAAKPKPKPKPKPIVGSYKASATPDPTSTDQVTNRPCKPHLPGSSDTHPFKIPAAGTLHVELANQFDWSLALRDAAGDDIVTSDGTTPTAKEMADASFTKAQAITINTCNFAGEPSVVVSYRFTYK